MCVYLHACIPVLPQKPIKQVQLFLSFFIMTIAFDITDERGLINKAHSELLSNNAVFAIYFLVKAI